MRADESWTAVDGAERRLDADGAAHPRRGDGATPRARSSRRRRRAWPGTGAWRSPSSGAERAEELWKRLERAHRGGSRGAAARREGDRGAASRRGQGARRAQGARARSRGPRPRSRPWETTDRTTTCSARCLPRRRPSASASDRAPRDTGSRAPAPRGSCSPASSLRVEPGLVLFNHEPRRRTSLDLACPTLLGASDGAHGHFASATLAAR